MTIQRLETGSRLRVGALLVRHLPEPVPRPRDADWVAMPQPRRDAGLEAPASVGGVADIGVEDPE